MILTVNVLLAVVVVSAFAVTTASAAAPEPEPSLLPPDSFVVQDGGHKKDSTAHDVKSHPKLTENTDPGPVVSGDGSTKTVVSITERPDGTTGMTIYDPAPGVTPEQLVEMLHKQGDSNAKVVTSP